MIDDRHISLKETLHKINQNLHKSDIWSDFIRIKKHYLVRRGDVKGYDNKTKKVLLSSVSHKINTQKISVGRECKEKLFKNLEFISNGLLLVKSIHNIQYVIYPQDIRCIISHSKSKKIYLENNLHTNFIEIKYANSSKIVKDFFDDDEILNYGMFIQFKSGVIFNLNFFKKNLLMDNFYNDPICGAIQIDKKVLKELNTN